MMEFAAQTQLNTFESPTGRSQSERSQFIANFIEDYRGADQRNRFNLQFKAQEYARMAIIEFAFTQSEDAYKFLIDCFITFQTLNQVSFHMKIASFWLGREMRDFTGIDMFVRKGHIELVDRWQKLGMSETLAQQLKLLRSIGEDTPESRFLLSLPIDEIIWQELRSALDYYSFSDRKERRVIRSNLIQFAKLQVKEFGSTEDQEKKSTIANRLHSLQSILEDFSGRQFVGMRKVSSRIATLITKHMIPKPVVEQPSPVSQTPSLMDTVLWERSHGRMIEISIMEHNDANIAINFLLMIQAISREEYRFFQTCCSDILQPFSGYRSNEIDSIHVTLTQANLIRYAARRLNRIIRKDVTGRMIKIYSEFKEKGFSRLLEQSSRTAYRRSLLAREYITQ